MDMSPSHAIVTITLGLLFIAGIALNLWIYCERKRLKGKVVIDIDRAGLERVVRQAEGSHVISVFPQQEQIVSEEWRAAKIASLRRRISEERKSSVPDLTLIRVYEQRLREAEAE